MVLTLYLINRIVELLEIRYVPLNLEQTIKHGKSKKVSYLSKELVLPLHPSVDGSLQRFQVCELGLNLAEVVSAVHIVHRTSQTLHVIQHLLHFSKLIGMSNIIYRTPQALDFNQVLLNFTELVVPLNAVYWIVQSFNVTQLSLYILEGVISLFNGEHWTSKIF